MSTVLSHSVVSHSLRPHGLYTNATAPQKRGDTWNMARKIPAWRTEEWTMAIEKLALFAPSLSRVRFSATPLNCSPPGSCVHWLSQARILQWVAISSFRGSSQPASPALAKDFFTTDPSRKPPLKKMRICLQPFRVGLFGNDAL